MSHLVIVGGSTGIGRDIQPWLVMGDNDISHISVLPRSNQPLFTIAAINNIRPITALLFAQRYRGLLPHPWEAEIAATMSYTNQIMEWWAGDCQTLRSVVMMASVAAVSVEEEQPVSYHACKAALVEMVKYYAVTLGPKNIRVNAIIPGLTIKPEARAFYDAHPELEATYKDITPLGRLGTVEDLAHLVDFLISDRSSYLTGQTIVLDGGISLRSPWALARRVSPALRELSVTQRKGAK